MERTLGTMNMCACMLNHFSRVRLLVTPQSVVCQVPLSIGFSRQEYWRGLQCPPQGNLPDPEIESKVLTFPDLEVGSLPLAPPGKTYYEYTSTLSLGYNICNSCWIEKQNLEEWDGDGGGKEAQERGDMCIHTADSHSCTAETNTTL